MQQELKTKRTKEKILALALEEFGKNGYAAASLNNICNAGIAKGLLYHNYAGKDVLYIACVQQCFHALTAYLQQSDIGTDLNRYAASRQTFFCKHPNEARLFLEAVVLPPETLKEEINEARAEFDLYNCTLYKEVLKTVTLRPGLTEKDALRYFKLLQESFNNYFGFTASNQTNLTEAMQTHEQETLKLIDLMLYGIAERDANK